MGEDSCMYTGLCHGGPLDGLPGESRFHKGFLLIDKPAGQVWIYDWSGNVDGFQFRIQVPLDRSRHRSAANGQEHDVVAAPWVGEN